MDDQLKTDDPDILAVLDNARQSMTMRHVLLSLANAHRLGREDAERKPPFTGKNVTLLVDCHRLKEEKVQLQAEVERLKVENERLQAFPAASRYHRLEAEVERLQVECEQLKTYVPYRKALQEVDRLKSLIPPCGSIVFKPTGEVRPAIQGEYYTTGTQLHIATNDCDATFDHPIYTRYEIPAETTELPRGKPLPIEASDA